MLTLPVYACLDVTNLYFHSTAICWDHPVYCAHTKYPQCVPVCMHNQLWLPKMCVSQWLCLCIRNIIQFPQPIRALREIWEIPGDGTYIYMYLDSEYLAISMFHITVLWEASLCGCLWKWTLKIGQDLDIVDQPSSVPIPHLYQALFVLRWHQDARISGWG